MIGLQGLFDWRRGTALWGSPLAMAAAVARFLAEQTEIPAQWRTYCIAAQWPSLASEAHRLRGLAGNLGLPALHAVLTDQALGDGALRRRHVASNCSMNCRACWRCWPTTHNSHSSRRCRADGIGTGALDHAALLNDLPGCSRRCSVVPWTSQHCSA